MPTTPARRAALASSLGMLCAVGLVTAGILAPGTATASVTYADDPRNASGSVMPSAPLAAPVLVTQWDKATGVLTVSWSPYDWAGLTPAGFSIEERVAGGTWVAVDNAADPLAQSHDFRLLTAGDTMEFRVRATAQDGTQSAYGQTTFSVINPGVPITAVTGDGTATLSWKPVAGADHYILVWYKWAPGTPGGTQYITCASDPCTYTLQGLENGAEYRAHINAISANGRVVALTTPDVSFTPTAPAPAPLAAPTVAVQLTGTQAQLTWAPYAWGSYGKDRFEIRWSNDGETTWNSVDNSSKPLDESAQVAGLTPGLKTTFQVRAVPTSGTPSAWGAASAVVPSPPASLTISASALDGAISVAWQPIAGFPDYAVGWYIPADSNSKYETISGLTCTTGPCTVLIPRLVNGTTYKVNMNATKPGSLDTVPSNYVTATPQPPAAPLDVVYPAPVTLEVGQAASISPDAAYSSGNPSNFVEGATKLPSGLHLNSANGDITGTPLTTADGLFPIVVSNNQGETLTVPLRLVVASHTVTLNYADHSGHVGSAMTLTPQSSHVIGSLRDFRVTSGTLPAGLVLDDTTGVISGTPTQPTSGPASLVVTARDDFATAAAAFTITVDSGIARLSVSYPNTVAHVGKAQGVTPTVSGATGALDFRVTSGTLPAGMVLDRATGVVSGTPTAAQSPASVTIAVTSGSASDSVTFTIEVLAHTLTLAYPSSTRDIGVSTQLTPAVSHAIGPVAYALTVGTLPAGLSLDPASGVISGTPTQVTSGPLALQMTATDSYGTASAPFTLEVRDPTPPVPVIFAAMTRDVERLAVIGTVANARAGDVLTPMVKLTGQDAFSAGRPVIVDDSSSFTWTRLVGSTRSAQVYFTITTAARSTGTSSTLRAAPPTVSGTGSRAGRTVRVVGATRNIAAGSTVQPWITVNGGKAVRGVPLQTDATGAFTWSYRANAGDSVSVRFNVRGVKSEPIEP